MAIAAEGQAIGHVESQFGVIRIALKMVGSKPFLLFSTLLSAVDTPIGIAFQDRRAPLLVSRVFETLPRSSALPSIVPFATWQRPGCIRRWHDACFSGH